MLLTKEIFQLNTTIFLLAIGVLVGCKKEDVPTTDGTPVFSIRADFDGSQVDIQAGNEQFYLYSDYRIDDCEQIVLVSRLAKDNSCTTQCAEEWLIEIADSNLLIGSFAPELVLATNAYPYANSQLDQDFRVAFESLAEGSTPLTYSWTFGDGSDSSEPDPVHIYNEPSGAFIVEHSITDQRNCSQSVSRQIVRKDQSQPECLADFLVQADSFGLQLTASASLGQPPFDYSWSDGSTGSVLQTSWDSLTTGEYCLTITDSQLCRSVICKTIDRNPVTLEPEYCAANFTFLGNLIANARCFTGAVIQYTDEEGKIYRSDWGDQWPESRFEISQVASFEPNEQGKPVMKFQLRGAALLYDAFGQAAELSNIEAVLGVAHP